MEIIFTKAQIADRVAQLGQEITEFYRGKDLTVVALMNGALPFAADLIRCIELDCYVDTLSVSSYSNCRSSGKIEFRSSLKLSPSGRHILLIDEVLDSGRTLKCLTEYFLLRDVASIRAVVMVEKELLRPDGLAHADWTGFITPNRYLVGYGLDANERYRNLPYIAALD